MQAGYRTDPIKSAKALKASLKVRKLDNAVYGSDVKAEALFPHLATVGTDNIATDTSVQVSRPMLDLIYPSDSVSNVGSPVRRPLRSSYAPSAPNEPTGSVITTPTARSVVSAPVLPTTTVAPPVNAAMFGLKDLLAKNLLGKPPSEVRASEKAAKQKTTVAPVVIPPTVVSTAPVDTTTSPVNSNVSNTASSMVDTTTPVNIPAGKPSQIPVNTSTTATTATESVSAPVGLATTPKVESIPPDTTKNYDNEAIQMAAEKLMTYIQEKDKGKNLEPSKQKTITLYRLDKSNAEPDRMVIKPGTGEKKSWLFRLYKSSAGIAISDQSEYAVLYSLEEAYKIRDRYNPHAKLGELTGLGLDDSPKKVHWAHRVNKRDRMFVMFPGFANGHVRLYTTGTRKPAVSYSHASGAFLNLVRDVVNSGTFKQQDYSNLDPKESHAANVFIKFTKPMIPSGVEFSTSSIGDIHTLRKRYKVLVGELSAGNHGQMVKDEMVGILRRLQAYKAISGAKVNNLISGLNEL